MGGGGGGRLFEAGRLLTFSAFRVGAYSRWALIRGWALIGINAVSLGLFFGAPFNAATVMRHFFPNSENPALPRSRINADFGFITLFNERITKF